MDSSSSLAVFAALSQASRLEAFRLLVRHEPTGLPAGEVARLLGVPQNTMSNHLAILHRAGLVQPLREGRSIIFRAQLERLRELMLFLAEDCCQAHPDVCAPLVAALTPCC
jgi:DNA-binding transcriptional ArsR family regulator